MAAWNWAHQHSKEPVDRPGRLYRQKIRRLACWPTHDNPVSAWNIFELRIAREDTIDFQQMDVDGIWWDVPSKSRVNRMHRVDQVSGTQLKFSHVFSISCPRLFHCSLRRCAKDSWQVPRMFMAQGSCFGAFYGSFENLTINDNN